LPFGEILWIWNVVPACCMVHKNVSIPAVLLINTLIAVIDQVTSAENRGLEVRHRPEVDGSITIPRTRRGNSTHPSVWPRHSCQNG